MTAGHCAEEIPEHVSLNASVLHSFDSDREELGHRCEGIHSAVNDVTVEPCYSLADAVEYDLMGHEHVDLIPIETAVGSSPGSPGRAAFMRAGLSFFFRYNQPANAIAIRATTILVTATCISM